MLQEAPAAAMSAACNLKINSDGATYRFRLGITAQVAGEARVTTEQITQLSKQHEHRKAKVGGQRREPGDIIPFLDSHVSTSYRSALSSKSTAAATRSERVAQRLALVQCSSQNRSHSMQPGFPNTLAGVFVNRDI